MAIVSLEIFPPVVRTLSQNMLIRNINKSVYVYVLIFQPFLCFHAARSYGRRRGKYIENCLGVLAC